MEILNALSAISSMVAKMMDAHAEALARKDKEIADLKTIIQGLKDAPK